MSLVNERGTSELVMPVAPMNYNNGGAYGIPVMTSCGNNNDGFNGDASWLILFIILALCGGGWGNGYGGFGGFGGGFEGGFPWLLNGQAGINANTNAGFDNAAINTQLNGIQSAITNGFSSAEVAGCNRAMDAMQTAYNNEIAALNRSFDSQTAMNQGFNNLQSQFAQCCCDNRLATNDLKYTIAQENCNDRAAISDGIRDIITAQTAGTQRILDQLCADKIDAKNDEIAQLRQRLYMSDLNASQVAQTAQIRAGQVQEVDALYNRLSQCPVPCMPVYGMQPIFTCNNNSGCGCGNGF